MSVDPDFDAAHGALLAASPDLVGIIGSARAWGLTQLRQLDEEPVGDLTHYTDAAGLIGILQNRELWATNIYFLNDTTDTRWGRDIVRRTYEREVGARLGTVVPGEDLLGSRLLPVGEGARLLTESFNEVFDGMPLDDIYVVSFSEEGNLLSQWQHYADRGAGYSITCKMPDLASACDPALGVEFFRVIYQEEQLRHLAELLLSNALHALRLGLIHHPQLEPASIYDAVGRGIALAAHEVAMRTKSSDFEAEREWRFQFRRTTTGSRALRRRYRATSVGVTPYVPLATAARSADGTSFLRNRLPISGIRIGPTLDKESSPRAIRLLLADHGYEADEVVVGCSEIPLRQIRR